MSALNVAIWSHVLPSAIPEVGSAVRQAARKHTFEIEDLHFSTTGNRIPH